MPDQLINLPAHQLISSSAVGSLAYQLTSS